MHAGYNIFTPTFESVSAADKKLSLQDLKLVNSEGWATETIWILNDNGTEVTGQTFSWNCPDNTGLDHWCWIDDASGTEATGVYINEGDGFYISCDGTDGIEIQVAGSVKLGKFTHTLHEGYNLTGNFSPVSLNLQALKLVNSEGWATETIWVLNENGTEVTGQTYSWNCPDNTGLDHWCWIDDSSGTEAEGITLDPGEGLYLSCDGTDGIVIEIDPVLIAK